MGRLIQSLLIVSLISVTSACGDTDPKIPENDTPEFSFWEAQSHREMMGWNGAVKSVEESVCAVGDEAGQEKNISFELEFNEKGSLVYYNSTGIARPQQTRNGWQPLEYYSYKYDESGKLVEVVADDFSNSPVTYKLTYGNHERYVPLIFPLGPYDYFLLQGVTEISCSEKGLSYVFDGQKASYEVETWMGVETTTFYYQENQPYPGRKIIELTGRTGESIRCEETSISYYEDGSLLSVDKKVKEGEVEIERTFVRYMESTLLPVTKLADAGGQMDWTYAYDKNKWCTQMVYKENFGEEMTVSQTYTYQKTDDAGNWTEALRKQEAPDVDETTDRVLRMIRYY